MAASWSRRWRSPSAGTAKPAPAAMAMRAPAVPGALIVANAEFEHYVHK